MDTSPSPSLSSSRLHEMARHKKCYFEYVLNRAQIPAPCGKPCRTRGVNKKPCVFPRSRLRFTSKSGSKVGAAQDGFEIALHHGMHRSRNSASNSAISRSGVFKSDPPRRPLRGTGTQRPPPSAGASTRSARCCRGQQACLPRPPHPPSRVRPRVLAWRSCLRTHRHSASSRFLRRTPHARSAWLNSRSLRSPLPSES